MEMEGEEDHHPIKSNDSVSKQDDKTSMIPLKEDFVPGDKDVICGRGKKCKY